MPFTQPSYHRSFLPPISPSYQVSDGEHAIELVCHRVMLHGHEERVEDDADSDGQVQEGIHHHDLHQLLHLQPEGAALPHQVTVGKDVPAGVTLLMGLLQFCTDQNKTEQEEKNEFLTVEIYKRMNQLIHEKQDEDEA